jgi:cellulase
MTLHMYMNESGKINVPVSPRVYLLDQSGQEYSYLRLLNQEISFDADVSNLPCGMNGALYLTSMEQDGGRSSVNPAGATYGTGYCDAQCPKSSFINGAPNTANYGACCAEMDLWEANVAATQLTPHPCSVDYLYQCNGTECLNSQFGGVCDEWGCGFNPYKGDPNYFAPGGVVDSSKTFTVVTQFLTTDGTAHGTLDEIRRLYVQDGKTIASDSIPFMVGGVNETTDSINPEYCNATAATTFTPAGGFAQMSKNLADGMVLIFSIWNDQYGNMTWYVLLSPLLLHTHY